MKYWCVVLLGLLWSCKADEIGPQRVDAEDVGHIKGRKVYIVNEGNFGRGGASISAYVPARRQHYSYVFAGANEGLLLGDVAQNLVAHAGNFYAVVNASRYLAVMDTANLRLVDSVVSNWSAPYHMTTHGAGAFVTDLFTNKLWHFDLQNYNTVQSISLTHSGGQLVPWQKYVAVGVANGIAMVEASSHRIDTTISLAGAIRTMQVDAQANLWVLSHSTGDSARISVVDESLTISKQLVFPSEVSPRFLCFNGAQDLLYLVLEDGIYRQSLSQSQLDLERVVALTGENVYAFNVDPYTGDLYLADALDFDQDSDIYRFDAEGRLIDQFKAGTISVQFHFQAPK